jgi:hypothetical protein
VTKRQLGGAFVATIIAPYLVALLMFLGDVLRGLAHFWELPAVAVLGSAALFFFGLPAFLASLLLMPFVNHAGRWARLVSMFGGAIIGTGFLALFFWKIVFLSEGLFRMGCGALAGAICGWIYWRIALAREPHLSYP